MKQDIKRILIFQTAYAGDVILLTPLIEACKQMVPEADLDILVIPQTAGLLDNNPNIRHKHLYAKRDKEKGIVAFFAWVRILKRARYDLVLLPHRSLRSAALVFMAGIPLRVGFDRSAGRWLLNRRVAYVQSRHEVFRNLSLIEALGWSGTAPDPRVYPGEAERKSVDNFLSSFDLKNLPFLIAAPGSVWATKRWLPERFGEVASMLYREKQIRTVFIGGAEDRTLISRIVESTDAPCVDAAGRMTYLESAELLRRSSAALVNDSAPCHLAVAVGTPVISVFGPTVPAFGFAPFGDENRVLEVKDLDCRPCSIHGGHKCPKGHFLCMNRISARQAVDAILSLSRQ